MARPRTRTDAPVRDKAFSNRLQKAIEGVPTIPEFGHGQQTWLRNQVGVSAEAVRKWFSGEARPRPAIMRKLAEVLEVDEAWLSLGIAPEVTPKQRRARNAVADGAVNVLAGYIQMSGGHVAFPGDKDPRGNYVDLYAIIRGAQLAVHVTLAQEMSAGVLKFSIPKEYADCTLIGAVQTGPMRCVFLQLTQALVEKHKVRRGGYYEVIVNKAGSDYTSGPDRWPRVTNFHERG